MTSPSRYQQDQDDASRKIIASYVGVPIEEVKPLDCEAAWRQIELDRETPEFNVFVRIEAHNHSNRWYLIAGEVWFEDWLFCDFPARFSDVGWDPEVGLYRKDLWETLQGKPLPITFKREVQSAVPEDTTAY